MTGKGKTLGGLLLGVTAALLFTPAADPQTAPPGGKKAPPGGTQVTIQLGTPNPKVTPKLEPIAETKLLMEGLAHANFLGVERILSKKPEEPQQWTFARGQALLLAETANLLMLRPPKNQGQPIWFERTMELRAAAEKLARAAGARDYAASRTAFVDLANSCNRCHQSFRIPVEITPFAEGPKGNPVP